jgi:hypothetical protein
MERLLTFAIVDNHVKAAAQGHEKFLLLDEGMSVAPHAAGHVIDPVVAHDPERDMDFTLDKRQVPPRVFDLGQFYQVGCLVDVKFHFGQV